MAVIAKVPPRIEKTSVIILDGGLDMVTDRQLLPPGIMVDAENFAVDWNHGYTRIAGYERIDGRSPKPSDTIPTFLAVESFVNAPTIGGTITGQSSGETAIVVGTDVNLLALTILSGAFTIPEVLKEGATVIGTTAATGVVTALVDAQMTAASADYYRGLIGAVPGEGPVRGVVTAIFNGSDEIYALRDKVGGSLKEMYRATSSGWVLVVFDNEVSFTVGDVAIPADGATLTQGGVTATINRVVLETGSWLGSDAAGRLVIGAPSGGNFSSGAATIGSTTLTLSGAETAITLSAGGKNRFHLFNFLGSNQDQFIYAVDGVNRGFEFDGTTMVPFETTAVPDTPNNIVEHKNYLFVSIGGSIFWAAPGLPYQFNASAGGGEIGVGDTVTNFNRQPASQESPSLGVYANNSTQFLFGNSPSDWELVPYKNGVGAYPGTAQTLDHAYVFDRNGIIDYRAAEQFGNYVTAAITVALQPFTNTVRDTVTCSTVERSRSQYRVFFSDGTGLYSTIVNGKARGTTKVRFPVAPNVAWESIKSGGNPISLFGSSTDGMVYELERGTSFDGVDISFGFTLSWYYGKNPRMIKRWRRVLPEVRSDGVIQFDMGFSLQYGQIARIPKPSDETVNLSSFGAPAWDTFVWDEFNWDGTTPAPELIRLDGSSVNIQFSVSGMANFLKPFTVSTLTLNYEDRRLER